MPGWAVVRGRSGHIHKEAAAPIDGEAAPEIKREVCSSSDAALAAPSTRPLYTLSPSSLRVVPDYWYVGQAHALLLCIHTTASPLSTTTPSTASTANMSSFAMVE